MFKKKIEVRSRNERVSMQMGMMSKQGDLWGASKKRPQGNGKPPCSTPRREGWRKARSRRITPQLLGKCSQDLVKQGNTIQSLVGWGFLGPQSEHVLLWEPEEVTTPFCGGLDDRSRI